METILEEINGELEAFLDKGADNKDLTDGVFEFLSSVSDSVQEEFEELFAGNNDKKRFLRALSRIFPLLLKTKVDTTEKIKRILKLAIETTLKIWQEQKLL